MGEPERIDEVPVKEKEKKEEKEEEKDKEKEADNSNVAQKSEHGSYAKHRWILFTQFYQEQEFS